MKMIIQCDYCQKTFDVKDNIKMLKHELKCCSNPKNKTCWTCGNTTIEYQGGYGGFMFEVCRKDKSINLSEKYAEGDDMKPCINWIASKESQ